MSIQRGTLDIEIFYGDDDFRRLTFETEDDNGNVVPYDLTAFDKIRMDAKTKQSQPHDATQSWILGENLLIKGADDNILQIDLTWDETQTLQAGRTYYYDIRFKQGGEVNTLIEGTLHVLHSTSNRP